MASFFALDLMQESATEVVIAKVKITKTDPIDASVTCSSNESGDRLLQIQLLEYISLFVSCLEDRSMKGFQTRCIRCKSG